MVLYGISHMIAYDFLQLTFPRQNILGRRTPEKATQINDDLTSPDCSLPSTPPAISSPPSASIPPSASLPPPESSLSATSGLDIPRRTRKWRGAEGQTVWYSDTRDIRVLTPSKAADSEDVSNGDIYVKYGRCGLVDRLWVHFQNENGTPRWKVISVGDVHPTHQGRFLIINKNLEPGWVVRKTVYKYKGELV